MENKSRELRQLLKKDELLLIVWVGTAHQAQLAQKIGFKVVGVSGADTCTQILGLPDAGLITMTELVQNVERVCRAVDIPVIVDCDTGFGNAINVRRSVDSIIRTGAAGLFMEDQEAPKRCGFVKGKEVISIEEAVGKYTAAVDVRNGLDSDFIIMARTDARGAVGGSLQEVIKRGSAYLDTGVDILYCEALQSRDEIKQVRKALPDCLLYVTPHTIKPPLQHQEMQSLGLCMAGCHITRAGSIAMHDFLIQVREGGFDIYNSFTKRTKSHPMGGYGIFDLSGFPKIAQWEKKYLAAEELEKYESSLGAYDPRVGEKNKE